MNATAAPRPVRRRLPRLAIACAILPLLAVWLLQPQRAGRHLLRYIGDTLGLDIQAATIDYRLRGTPQLVLGELTASRSGDAPLLRARRVFLSLPWRTLRTRGSDLTIERVELDEPTLDLPALQRWLATRPTSEPSRLPTLTHGLRVRAGRIDNDDWRIDGLAIDLPALHPGQPAQAKVQGRYLDAPISIPADLTVTVARPQQLLDGKPCQVSGSGHLTLIEADGWRVPARIFLTGPLRIGKDSVLMQPAKLGIAGRYVSAGGNAPFRLGLYGPMAFNNALWRFVPVTMVLSGDGAIPSARARGSLSVGRRLGLHLDGSLAGWPDAWPALPAPLSASKSALLFALDYKGAPTFTDPASLSLRRDASALEAHFRLPEVLEWLDAESASSPLPPLAGTLTTPRIELGGATLEGVEIEMSGE